MTKFAFDRDNILTDEERAASARKCISLLNELSSYDLNNMNATNFAFYIDQKRQSENISYALSERQLIWLRNLVERHCQ